MSLKHRESATSNPGPFQAGTAADQFRHYAPLGVAVILVGLSVVARIAYRGVITSDLNAHILFWYSKFQDLGIRVGLGKDFYDYSPPYMYLIALATLTSRFMSAVTAIKLMASAFDVYVAFVLFKIVRLRYPRGHLPYLAAAIWFSAPTVVANAGVWGQADSTYMGFLLTCFYLLMIDKPWPAMLFFSVSFAFKPQPLFLAPLLVLLVLWKRLPWFLSLMVPAVYALAVWPAVIFGRTWWEVINVYLGRTTSGKALTHNAATLYAFIPRDALGFLSGPGIALAAVAVVAWIIYTWRSNRRVNHATFLLLGLVCVTLTAFVLPNMHERYFYPADTLSIALAFWFPELWFIPVLFQVVSGLSYSVYLLGAPSDNVAIAAGVNLLTLAILLVRQAIQSRTQVAEEPAQVAKTQGLQERTSA